MEMIMANVLLGVGLLIFIGLPIIVFCNECKSKKDKEYTVHKRPFPLTEKSFLL